MAWFIIQTERKMLTKYFVEAEDEESALASSEKWISFRCAESGEAGAAVIGGPFTGESDARDDVANHVEG